MSEQASEFILIVDDNATNLYVLSQALKDIGIKVRIAMEGVNAIKIAQQHPPELILLDVQMPGIDGFETCIRLKANPITQDIPIIFMTALTDSDNKVKGLSLGAVDYITKPFEEQEVIARVNIHLQLRQLNKALQNKTQLLHEKNLDLEQTLVELKNTQTQLIQAEKMSGLGQMVAGIAHEINNPISFISGNLTPASEYVQNLLELIKIYQQECSKPSIKLQKFIEALDLDFISTDLPKLLMSMRQGAERIRHIVLSLRNFSRLDEAEMKAVDIHEGLESTLLILQHRFQAHKNRSEIALLKNYGKLPLVTCYPSLLNQVFINILNNAIAAIEELANQKYPFSPCIQVTTELTNNNFVKILISDNGIGMNEDVQKNIFNPFFTTKPVGSGMGLGLSVSYQIIVGQHGGKITCISVPLEGTEFVIEIPCHLGK